MGATTLFFRRLTVIIFILLLTSSAWGQSCKTTVSIQLENIDGGVYGNKGVIFTKIGTSEKTETKSNYSGIATASLDCESRYEVKIENNTRKKEIRTSERSGTKATFTYTYSHDMAESDKIFAMSTKQKAQLESEIKLLPDTTFVTNSRMTRPRNYTNYTSYKFQVNGLDNRPLVNETVVFTGRNRNKSVKGTTSEKGILLVYLPKGDEYSVNFLFNKNFAYEDIPFSQGTSNAYSNIQYIGTKEILRRKKAEEERIKAEEIRIAREEKEYAARLKREKIDRETAIKRDLALALKAKKEGVPPPTNSSRNDLVVEKVLSRNNWSQKLIVCDVTGSMNPYVTQLLTWCQLNIAKERNLQFVFFNDGDNKSTSQKTIGETGGIYYQNKPNISELIAKVGQVQSKGSGGDCPENNMEALIKGVKLSNPYKELVMIADNKAPVKDLELLSKFDKPVHIILCGASNRFIHADYLKIAWKTKGSIHTIEEDITKIARMMEGETIQVMGRKFKIMGGEFVQITGS